MGKILERRILRFDGGITSDPRDERANMAQIVTNFNALSNNRRLIPYHDSVDGNSNVSNDLMQKWCIALSSGTTYRLYGLGRQTATNKVRIFFKNLTTGGSTDLDDNGWSETANNLATQTTPNYNCFVYYPNQAKVYGLHGSRYIYEYDPSGSAGFGDTYYDLSSFTTCAQGLVHSQYDILYIPVDNKIYSKDGSGTFTLALTIPVTYVITSICEDGANIAIAAAAKDGSHSRVYIWNTQTSLNNVTENIYWGDGSLKIIEMVDGILIGISQYGGQTMNGFSTIPATNKFVDRVTFRYRTSGSFATKFLELLTSTISTQLPIAKQTIDNRLYFMMKTTLNGAAREGVWSVGRNLTSGGFTLFHEHTPNNDTATVSGSVLDFFQIGDYMFQGYIDNGANKVSKTNDQASYTATSIIETTIQNEGDASIVKVLKGVTAITEAMPAAGQIIVEYKKDEESSYTTIYTDTTDNDLIHNATQVESTGVALPEYKEITFRVKSTGGASVTGLAYTVEVEDKRPY